MQATIRKKTDNDLLSDKVALRASNIDLCKDRPIRVLDCFGGHGVVWSCVARKTGKIIDRVAIDNRTDLKDFHLHGDSIKVLAGIDITQFDVIDIDAYGVPCDEIKLVVESGFRGTIFVTAIQTMNGCLPFVMLESLGFPREILKKAPSIPARHGWSLFRQWLALIGVEKITHRSKGRKHYLCFRINGAVDGAMDSSTQPANTSADHA